MSLATLSPSEVKDVVHGSGERALLDVREHGQYGEGHLFLASNAPYSRLELIVPLLVPNPSTLCILYDDGDGTAEKAAARLQELGYDRLALLSGGAPAWQQAGLTLFKGVNVPSKAFGEIMEAARHTPTVTADELEDWERREETVVVIDGRPFAEFEKMSIPGARCVPNGELLYRFDDLIRDDKTRIVINCAGRTRGLVGVQSLIDAGIRNRVFALENGTQGWALSGRELCRGMPSLAMPEPSPRSVRRGAVRATRLAREHAVPRVSAEIVAAWQQERDRTLYLFDVRTEAEYLHGHVAGARHAPAVQLVQATDEFLAVRAARIALVDDNGLRATMSASWLRQMGHDAAVVIDPLQTMKTVQGPGDMISVSSALRPVAQLSPTSLRDGTTIIDLRPSMAYRRSRIPGSLWSIRPRLQDLDLRASSSIVLVAEDPRVVQLAARDLGELCTAEISYLETGVRGWAGKHEPSPHEPCDADAIDHLFFVHDRHAGNLEASRAYLAWEMGLVQQMDERERGIFKPLMVPA